MSMAGDPKLHAMRHTGRNVDGDDALGGHPPLAAASLALRLDLLPRPLTRGASAGRHHRAEDAAPNLLDLPGTATGSTADGRGPGLRTGALAALAGFEGVHRDVTADPERRLLERKQDGGPKVLAPAGPGPRSGLAAAPERPSAEERLEDLADVGGELRQPLGHRTDRCHHRQVVHGGGPDAPAGADGRVPHPERGGHDS